MPPERPPQAIACMLLVASLIALASPTAALTIDPFRATCPVQLEGEAHGNATVTLDVEASSDVALYRTEGNDSERIAVLSGSGTYLDAEVRADTTYDYHVVLKAGDHESPPCDRIQITTQSDSAVAQRSNSTTAGPGQSNGSANGTGQTDGSGNGTGHGVSGNTSSQAAASTPVRATLSACPASIKAQAGGDGSVRVTVNTTMDVDGVVVQRSQAGAVDNETVLVDDRVFFDTDAEAGAAYTYSVAVIVEGHRSDICDSVELSSVPTIPGAAAGLAVTLGSVIAYAGWRHYR